MTVRLSERRDAAPAVCAHCGFAVPAALVRSGEAHQFCCHGCQQVYTLVREWGFDQYYRLVEKQQGVLEPARVTGRSFEDFDDVRAQMDASVEVGEARRRTRLSLEGVQCAACVWLVEKLPSVLAGVDEVRLNYGTGVAEVTWRPGHTRLSTVGRALDRLGYTPHLHRRSQAAEMPRLEDRALLARVGVAAACAMNLMFVSGALYAGDFSDMTPEFQSFFRRFALIVAVPALSYSAKPFFQTALAGLRMGIVHIDLPIAIAITAAGLASAWNTAVGHGPIWFDSLAMLIAALLGARFLQRRAQRAAIDRADTLRDAAFVEFARRIDGDGPGAPAVEVPIAAIGAGDRIEVRSGELIPADGVVLAGQSTIDNAVLTGEAVPLPVREGDAVNAGATNLGARLIVRVDAAGERTRVGALLAVVEEALGRKAALVQMTDRLAQRFVYTLLAVAGATALWVGIAHGPAAALQRVVALLVVSCPCALGLSVPLALSVALMRGARAGLFIKDPDALERLRKVDTVLLDKTGTLTEGRATVSRWLGDPASLDLARALEAQSSHPVARAFQTSAGRSLQVVRSVEAVEEIPAQGIAGRVNGRDVRVGTRAHVTRDGATLTGELIGAETAIVADGLSPVFVAIDGQVVGLAGIGDPLRTDTRTTLQALRARGIHVRILSGDHPAIAAAVGARLGLPAEDVQGGLSPEAKRDIVAHLTSRPGRRGAIVMVGDGVNDAAALALADVGIAVHGGTGATMVAADIVLTREGVSPLLELLDGARRLRGIIGRNVGFSLVYNAAASSLAVAGLIGPLAAAVLMPLSSLTVVISSAATRTFTGSRAPRVFLAAAED